MNSEWNPLNDEILLLKSMYLIRNPLDYWIFLLKSMDLIRHPLNSYNIEYAGPNQQILNRKPTCLLNKQENQRKIHTFAKETTKSKQNQYIL